MYFEDSFVGLLSSALNFMKWVDFGFPEVFAGYLCSWCSGSDLFFLALVGRSSLKVVILVLRASTFSKLDKDSFFL